MLNRTVVILFLLFSSSSAHSLPDNTTIYNQSSYSIPPLLQKYLPHRLINNLSYFIAEKQWPWFKNYLINDFIAQYNIDMSDYLYEQADHYQNFNDFFVRQLKKGVRPLPEDQSLITSPVDGTITQIGSTQNGQMIQAKKHNYSLSSLFAGHTQLVSSFEQGVFATIYLAPGDYHRVHMPVNGTLKQMLYVPGSFYSVNEESINNIEGVLSKNERVISVFETDYSKMAIIMVGAMVVGSMETVWNGKVTSISQNIISHLYDDTPVYLERGSEMGKFMLGSTVIVMFAHPGVSWLDQLHLGQKIKMGTAMGRRTID